MVMDMVEDKGADSADEESKQIRISLILAHGVNDPSLEVPSDPIAVPSNLRRKGLSAVVNHLLGRKVQSSPDDGEDSTSDSNEEDEDTLPPSLPFDFVINGKLLRMSVEGAARRDGLGFERAIEIRYFPARTAPTGSDSSDEFPDWVSALSFAPLPPRTTGNDDDSPPSSSSSSATTTTLCAGCYDGTLRAVSAASCSELASIRAHSGAIKSLSCATAPLATTPSAREGVCGAVMVATGSMDQTLLTHTLTVTTGAVRGDDDNGLRGRQKAEFAPHAVYTGGHANSIESVALLPNDEGSSEATILASGDWDGGMCLWKVPRDVDGGGDGISGESVGNDVPKKKRRGDAAKTSKHSDAAAIRVAEVQPAVSWKAHASNVSGIAWGEERGKHVITSSWDHSCKVWDCERQDCLLTLNGSRVVSALGRCSNSDIVATGHPDCTIRLWDMRVGGKENAGNVSENILKPSHKAWISALQWSPTEPHVLATNSHDGSIKMWDIRSSLPLHTVRAHAKGEKGLSIAFGSDALFGGGSDCVVKKFAL